jgi:hypothetical protein
VLEFSIGAFAAGLIVGVSELSGQHFPAVDHLKHGAMRMRKRNSHSDRVSKREV